MKIVINRCYGGFGLSHEAVMRYADLAGIKIYAYVDARKKDGRIDFSKMVPYDGKEHAFVIHYYTAEIARGGASKDRCYFKEPERNDPLLVRVVEEMGEAASGRFASLKVVEVPDGIEWEIDEYDGMEVVEEKHRSWC